MAHQFPEFTDRLVSLTQGMEEVSKDAFFASVGHRDVHPTPDITSFKFRHHWSEWRLRGGRLVGVSYSDSHASEPTRFFKEKS